jgi:ElaB/YqjD/DUF883 family membrane-anchored ribosome-binding protein
MIRNASNKEIAMSLKSQVESIANDFSGQVEHLPERAEQARKAVKELTRDLADRATAMVRQHPGKSILGAFIIGYAIAKVAKHA